MFIKGKNPAIKNASIYMEYHLGKYMENLPHPHGRFEKDGDAQTCSTTLEIIPSRVSRQ